MKDLVDMLEAFESDIRDNIGRPRNRGLISKDRSKPLDVVNAVLKCKTGRVSVC